MPFLADAHPDYLPLPDGARIPYLRLGNGPRPLVLIPGAGDGLTNVVEGARRLTLYFLRRIPHYRMLLLSRRDPLPAGFTPEQHADDLIAAMDRLNWGPTTLECNSAGGPVGQWIAVKQPERVSRLILSCTLHRTVPATRTVLETWIALARAGRWPELNWSSIEYTFRPKTVARYRWFRGLLGLMSRPNDPQRLPRILEELLELDQRALLLRITCPTLVIGGEDDRLIPAAVQQEMAELIPGSRLQLYPGYGHGNDQENPAYEVEVRRFTQ